MVMKNDTVPVNETSTGMWYLVDALWLNSWKEFVNGLKQCAYATEHFCPRQSVDPLMMFLSLFLPAVFSNTLPGPVDNARLLDASGVPLPGMRVSVDYRGVNELVSFLLLILSCPFFRALLCFSPFALRPPLPPSFLSFAGVELFHGAVRRWTRNHSQDDRFVWPLKLL